MSPGPLKAQRARNQDAYEALAFGTCLSPTGRQPGVGHGWPALGRQRLFAMDGTPEARDVKVTPDVTRDVTHQLVEVCEPIHGPLVKWVVGAPLSRIEAFPVLAVDARTWRRSCGVGASGSPFRLAKDATGPRLTSTPPDWAAKQQTGTARTQFGEQSQLLIGGSRRRRGHEGFSDWGLGGGVAGNFEWQWFGSSWRRLSGMTGWRWKVPALRVVGFWGLEHKKRSRGK